MANNFFTRTFTALATKINPAWLTFSSYSDTPQAIHMSRDFKTYAKEGYKNSDTLYKCISYLIRNGAAIPPKLYTDATRKKTIDQHPLLEKLNNPNNEQTGVQYRESVLGYKLLAGNSFQYVIRASKSGPPDELWVLRPDRMEILIQGKRGIVGYRHQDMDQPIDPGNIGHTKYWNPDDDNEQGMGMSPVTAAALNIDMQIAGKKWNLGLLQNGARPPGIWKIPVLMGRNERQKLEDKLNEKFGGAKAAGKSPLFDGGLDWKSTGLAPAQMDYLDSLKYNGGSIANILNMAPQLVGDTSSSTYDNMEQAKVWSYTEGIFPELDDLYALWNNWLLPMYPDLARSGAYLYYDKESVEVIQKLIQAQKDAQAQRANDLWMNGLALQNEARTLAGLPTSPEGNVWRIGGILVPKGKLQEYAEQSLSTPAAPPPALPEPLQITPAAPDSGKNPTEDEKNPPEGGKQQEEDGKQPPQKRLSPLALPRSPVRVKALDLETTEQKQAYVKSVEAQRSRWQSNAEERLQDYFAGEKKAVLAAINEAALPSTADIRAEHALNGHASTLQQVLLKLYQDIGQDIGSEVASAFAREKRQRATWRAKDSATSTINMFSAQTVAYLLKLAGTKVSQINDTTLASLRQALADGVAAGEGIPELARRVDDLYLQKIIPNRSTTIARTEVVGASNVAAMEAARSSGLTLNKVWLATGDNRTRPDHLEADGQEVPMDQPFVVGDEELMQPGDPAGSAGEIVNCRCTVYFKRADVSTGDMTDETEDESSETEKSARPSRRVRREAYQDFMNEVLV